MNLAIYVLVYNYINHAINRFMDQLMGQCMLWVSTVALTLVTLWILIQGYRIVTGQSREPAIALMVNAGRVAFIVTAASTLSIGSSNLHDLFTDTLPNTLNQWFTGSTETIPETINTNLTYTVAAMTAIDAVQAPTDDVATALQKARASDLAIFGTASPPMAVGAMLLMYNFAIALVVGLGPLFILCLLFEQTKALFHKWLMYGIGTVFSLAMLSVVSSIVLNATVRGAAALWSSNFINNLLNQSSEGLSTQALEQGGLGLLMTMLIIAVPPMAGKFFSATLGNFMHFSAFGAGGRARRAQSSFAASPGQSHPVASTQNHAIPIQARSLHAPAQQDAIKRHAGLPEPAPQTIDAPPLRTNPPIQRQGSSAAVAATSSAAWQTNLKASASTNANDVTVHTGLGDEVDALVAKSPTLQREIVQLDKRHWKFKFGDLDKGSFADRNDDPPTIYIDIDEKNNAQRIVQTLSHEVGHALYNYTPDYSSRQAYVDGALADEGAATLNNITVEREILSHGGPDISIAGRAVNRDAYNAAYDKYLVDGDANAARLTIGHIYGKGEQASTPVNGEHIFYEDYYGDSYDKKFPKK